MAMMAARLPLGLPTFTKVRQGGYAYVDKTKIAVELINAGEVYFLARPRRFGKSLFLDTLRNLFEAKRELFSGLYAEHEWDWSVKYPVIKLDMSGGFRSIDGLDMMLADNLRYSAEYLGLELSQHSEASRLFKELIWKAHRVYYGLISERLFDYRIGKPRRPVRATIPAHVAKPQCAHGFAKPAIWLSNWQ